MTEKPCGTKADGPGILVMNRGGRIMHRFYKRQKNRMERHKARLNPECVPTYGLYCSYEA